MVKLNEYKINAEQVFIRKAVKHFLEWPNNETKDSFVLFVFFVPLKNFSLK